MNKYSSSLVGVFLLFITACGGGGGGSTPINPNAVFSIDTNSVSFEATIGSSIEPSSEMVSGTVTDADQSVYVVVEISEDGIVDPGRTYVAGNSLVIFPKPANQVSPGQHSDQVRVRVCNDQNCNSEVRGSPKTIGVSYDVSLPVLTLSETEVEIDGSFGDGASTAQVSAYLSTADNSYSLSVTTDYSEAMAAAVSISGADSVNQYTNRINITADSIEPFASGSNNGQITFTATVEGYEISQSIPMSVIAPTSLILARETGVAFAKFPGVSRLSHQVLIEESYGKQNIPWQATTSSEWLTITESGTTTNGALNISANPEGLSEGMHYATISVSSSDEGINNNQTINVGLWISNQNPTASSSFSATYSSITADTIRPYVYLNNEGSSIEVYNAYTRQRVAVISEVVTRAGTMRVGPNGDYLYVADISDNSVSIVDLASFEVVDEWQSEDDLSHTGFSIFRPQDKDILFVGNAESYFARTGEKLFRDSQNSFWVSSYSVYTSMSVNKNRMCTLNEGISPYTMVCLEYKYSNYKNEFKFTSLGGVPHGTGSNGRDVAITRDGKYAYIASGAPYEFTKVDVDSMTVIDSLTANSYPTAVELTVDDRLIGATFSWYGPNDLFIFDVNDNLVRSDYISGYADNILARAVAVTPDGLMTIVLTDDPKVSFQLSY